VASHIVYRRMLEGTGGLFTYFLLIPNNRGRDCWRYHPGDVAYSRAAYPRNNTHRANRL